jgi:hypothetical protein
MPVCEAEAVVDDDDIDRYRRYVSDLEGTSATETAMTPTTPNDSAAAIVAVAQTTRLVVGQLGPSRLCAPQAPIGDPDSLRPISWPLQGQSRCSSWVGSERKKEEQEYEEHERSDGVRKRNNRVNIQF